MKGEEVRWALIRFFIKITERWSYIGAIDRGQAVGFGIVEGNVHGFVVVNLKYCRWHLH